MVEIVLWSALCGIVCGAGGFAAGFAVCSRRHRLKKTASAADSFLTLLRH